MSIADGAGRDHPPIGPRASGRLGRTEDGMRESNEQFLERFILEIGPSVQPPAFR